MTESDMTVPFVLGLISGIFLLILGILSVIYGAMLASVPLVGGLGGIVLLFGTLETISGILVLVGSILVRNPDKAKVGSILILVFGILGFVNGNLGLIVFPILAIVGGALGLSKSK